MNIFVCRFVYVSGWCLILFIPTAGEVSFTRSISKESMTGYDMSISVSDGRNTAGPTTFTIRIIGKYLSWYISLYNTVFVLVFRCT